MSYSFSTISCMNKMLRQVPACVMKGFTRVSICKCFLFLSMYCLECGSIQRFCTTREHGPPYFALPLFCTSSHPPLFLARPSSLVKVSKPPLCCQQWAATLNCTGGGSLEVQLWVVQACNKPSWFSVSLHSQEDLAALKGFY